LNNLAQSLSLYTGGSNTSSIDRLCNTDYNTVSDSEGEEPGDESAGEEDSSSHSIPPSHLGWANMGCASGGNSDGIGCCSSDHPDGNDVPPTIESTPLIKDKHIHMSGHFTISQNKFINRLYKLGASVVRTGVNIGRATILIRGGNCRPPLLKQAEERNNNNDEENVLVLNEAQLRARLHQDGCSNALDTNTSSTTINESEIVNTYKEKCQFTLVRGMSLCKKCNIVLPPELNKVYHDDGVDVEYGEHEFTDQRFLTKVGINRGKMKQMRIRVVRTKQKGESEWQYHYTFDFKSGNSWYRYCVKHNVTHDNCTHCNKCTHLDPERGLGFAHPRQQCIKCFSKIACQVCNIAPRLQCQSACDKQYKNHCARCYRVAMKEMRSEDISIEYLLNSDIPLSSVDTEVFGLPIRPDAEITGTCTPYNHLSYEHDDQYGHVQPAKYPAEAQHQRTVELNERRPWEKGKITIRQHPLDTYKSERQGKQNKLMVRVIKVFMKKEIGLRSDGLGGKRVIVFIGHCRTNYHYQKALLEKESGYWDDVLLVAPR